MARERKKIEPGYSRLSSRVCFTDFALCRGGEEMFASMNKYYHLSCNSESPHLTPLFQSLYAQKGNLTLMGVLSSGEGLGIGVRGEGGGAFCSDTSYRFASYINKSYSLSCNSNHEPRRSLTFALIARDLRLASHSKRLGIAVGPFVGVVVSFCFAATAVY